MERWVAGMTRRTALSTSARESINPASSIQNRASKTPSLHHSMTPFFFAPPGGEIESRLAYTQKSEGQNLPGRRQPIWKVRAVS
jgi:hypothetical protein